MGCTPDQFASSVVKIGLASADALKVLWRSLPPGERPKDGDSFSHLLVASGQLTAFQARRLLDGQGDSLVLGDYELLDAIGAGGMGQVFKARHRRMKRLVAIKLLPSALSKDSDAIKRFEREVEAAAKLTHPNIVVAYDAGKAKEQHFLVMEYVEGLDLSSQVKRHGPMVVSQTMHCVLQAARGLEYAHEQGVVHRDIKPANLLLDLHGVVKILDMGLARLDSAGADQDQLTGTGQIMGTVDFMAPEQAMGTKNADARADIYSLGITLWYLLTGKVVYEGETVLAKLMAHQRQPIPSLSAACPSVPAALEAVFTRMVAKRPDQRFQTMQEVLDALAACVGISGATPRRNLGPEHPDSSSPNPAKHSGSDSAVVAGLQPTIALAAPAPAGAEETIAPSSPEMDTDPQTQNSLPVDTPQRLEQLKLSAHRPPRISWWRKAGVLAVACSAAALVLGGTIIAITNHGRADLEVAATVGPKEVEVTIDENVSPNPSKKLDLDAAIYPEASPAAASTEPTKNLPAMPSAPLLAPNPEPTAPEVTAPEVTSPTPTTPPSTPELDPTSPVAMSSMPSIPEPAAAPAMAGRTLIVGIAPGEISDLGAAFAQANPGDTILIRHRGPLEFPPVDLTGKTPLTIAGDVKDGVDYWPILRQVAVPEGTPIPAMAKGLFFGKNLQLTFRKVHLGIGGHQRQPIESAFHLDAGKLEFADCTVTVAASGEGLDPVGPLIPLVQCVGTPTESLELTFQRTLVRGGRLNGCLNAVEPGPIQLVADQFLWAGGPAPWLTLQECGQPCRVRLAHATLYNLGGLALAALKESQRESGSPVLEFQVDHCLLTGPRVASPPLLQVTAPGVSSLEQAVSGRWVDWKGASVVWHQITGDAASTTKGASPQQAWCELFGLADRSLVVADPMFRVRPSGVELQEATARDFEPRFGRAIKKPPRDANLAVGPSSGELPVVLACINSRNLATESLSSVPRGEVRVLRVHQADGPFRTLEDAMSKVQSDDIIEIADNAVYVPIRNFASAAALGVLDNGSIECLSIRVVDDSQAIMVLRDDAQQGLLPGSSRDSVSGETGVYLLATRCRILSLDGLHFLSVMAKPTQHSVIYQRGPCLRVTNCTFVDVNSAPSAPGNRFVCHTTHYGAWGAQGEWLAWFENSAFLYAATPQSLQDDPRQSEIAISCIHYAPDLLSKVARNIVCRNCLFGSNLIGVESGVHHLELAPLAESLSFEQCTLLGRMANLTGGRTREKLSVTDNLVIAPDNPLMASPLEVFSATMVEGGSNAYWQTTGMIRAQDRNQGSLSLLPGPLLKTMPVFAGIATSADTLKPFRLKSGPPWDKMATDGGTVGVRFEYLPAPPPFRQEMLKRVK